MRAIKESAPLLLLTIPLLFLTAGCGTTLRISGSPGTEFSGHVHTTGSNLAMTGSNVPWTFAVGGNDTKFEECEFRKTDRQGDLVLEIRRHGAVAARAEAAAGTSGVKARQEGSKIIAETIP